MYSGTQQNTKHIFFPWLLWPESLVSDRKTLSIFIILEHVTHVYFLPRKKKLAASGSCRYRGVIIHSTFYVYNRVFYSSNFKFWPWCCCAPMVAHIGLYTITPAWFVFVVTACLIRNDHSLLLAACESFLLLGINNDYGLFDSAWKTCQII